MSNSPLVNYTKLSPNNSGKRTHVIDTITIHTMAGNLSVETCGELFANPNREASSNYGIGSDGRIGMYVEEGNRSWCSSNRANDQRAVTIEVASIDNKTYIPSDKAYSSLINLCVDICKRNNINEMKWLGDKNLIGQVDKQNMTAHRWFAAKACPGSWLYDNMGTIASTINAFLRPVNPEQPTEPETPDTNEETFYKFLKAKGLNDFAIYGILGNIYAESGCNPNNLQNSYERKLGYSDNSYTEAVDKGTYTNFIRDKAGYGLCQWTFWSRKEGLYNYAKSKNVSIADMTMQMEYFWKEASANKALMSVLNSATSIKQASNAMLHNFEKPADQSAAIEDKRAKYGEEVKARIENSVTESKPKVPYKVRVTVVLNIRKGPGTNYPITGVIRTTGVYTIVEEVPGEQGADVWGKLKSGLGYIAIDPKYNTKL